MISKYTKTLRVINSKYYSICVNKNGKDINKEFNETCIIQHPIGSSNRGLYGVPFNTERSVDRY